MWGSLGKYADGWAKFAVAIGAVGWFCLQIADRHAPRTATVTIGQPEMVRTNEKTDLAHAVAREETSEIAMGITNSVFSQLVREFGLATNLLASNPFAHLAAVLAIGLAGGLALQPRMRQWGNVRAVRAARRRADRHANDLRLLAAHDAKGNVPGPGVAAIQPMKRH